jgi:AraC-like DNA-binding protein
METSLNILRRRLTAVLFAIMTIIFNVFCIYYFQQKIIEMTLVHFFLVIINVLYFVLTVRKIYRHSVFIGLYVVYAVVSLFFIVLTTIILGQHGYEFTILWLLVLPVATITFANSKTAFYISIVSALLQAAIMFLWRTIESDIHTTIVMDINQVHTIYLFTVLSVIVVFVYSFYSAWRMDIIRHSEENNVEIEEKVKEFEKYQNIYNQIIICFEEEKIYRNSELTLSELAERLNTNVTYIQRAMKHHGQDTNFNNFVNHYRIAAIKKAIDNEEHSKYTIGYLYQTAGFKYQSTFNKVFKQFEGTTPSEYIALHKSKRKKEKGR